MGKTFLNTIARQRLWAFVIFLFAFSCIGENTTQTSKTETNVGAKKMALEEESDLVKLGKKTFKHETFEGNDRTCATCHIGGSTALSVPQAQSLFSVDPTGPLFRSIDSDDGVGNDYSLLLRDATVRIPLLLAANVTVDEVNHPNVSVGADGRITLTVRRGVPATKNIAFEPFIMYDARENDLVVQAGHAVETHNQPGRLATLLEKQAMAAFQQSQFTSPALKVFAEGGAAPTLPLGVTDSEKRGRVFFEDVFEFDGSKRGLCAMCHSGPLLNTVNQFNPLEFNGSRFATNFSSEFNKNQYPVFTFRWNMPDGSQRVLHSPDPGVGTITGDPCAADPLACVINPGSTASVFKIPTLWNVKNTAPYFHDSSAKSLDEMMNHYQAFFHITAVGLQSPLFEISNQDKADILAYLQLL